MFKQSKTIYFIPRENATNRYIDLMKLAYEKAGFCQSSLFRADTVSLNWIEQVHAKGKIGTLFDFLKRLSFLYYANITGKKMIWTFHNLVSHEEKKNKYETILRNFIFNHASTFIIHSESSRELFYSICPKAKQENVVYLPHPNYVGAYPESLKEESLSDDMVITFIGAASPYKNVDVLIKAFNHIQENVTLRIYGKPSSQEYGEYLSSLVVNKKIQLYLKFVKDEEISSVLESTDIIITPYDSHSMVNSGTQILAFSYGKTVISTLTYTLKDLPKNLWFEINQENTLEESIISGIKNILEQESKESLNEKGEKLKNIIESENSIKNISSLIVKEIK